MQLDLKITEQTIKHLTTEKRVVANSKNYLECKFIFDSEWQDIPKTAVFRTATGIAYNVPLTDDICKVPHEVINFPMFTVSVFGGDRITVNKAVITVEESGYEEGIIPEEPTPDVYSLILEKAEHAERIAQEVAEGESARVEAEIKRAENEAQREASYNELYSEAETLKAEMEAITEQGAKVITDVEDTIVNAQKATEETNKAKDSILEAKEQGEFDGYTPVKGVDYYTEAEKNELVTEILETVTGDIENALDAIIAIQKESVGG